LLFLAVHPLFALVAQTADRAKAVAVAATTNVINSSRDSLLDLDTSVEVDIDSVYGLLRELDTSHVTALDELAGLPPSSGLLAWLNVDLELTCSVAADYRDRFVKWPASMAVRSAPQCLPAPPPPSSVIIPSPCAAERVAELEGDLIATVRLLPSPFISASDGAPVDHPAYVALQRWYASDSSGESLPSLATIDALFAINGERDESSVPLGKWLRRYLEIAQSSAVLGSGNSLLWTDKYRPMQGSEVAANIASVRLLSHWLAGWTAPSEIDVETFPEAMLTDNERPCCAVLLVGPEGSCKTSAAYACAARHLYNVIEINAGSARTGRQTLQLFSEATQSHNLSASRLGANEQQSGAIVVDPDSGHSMILFEEIDVHTDDDKGFFAALKTLLASTKRPIVLTCNKLTSAIRDLRESVPEIKTMHFVRPELTHTVARCALITFAERRCVSLKAIAELVLAHDGDMRRVLHDLQFWCATLTGSASHGALDGVFGLAHLNACHGGLDFAVRRLADAPALSTLDSLALEALPLDAVHRIATAYATTSADVATLEHVADATDHLSLCIVAEQRVREHGSLYDADDTHMPDAFDARNTELIHASVDEDDRWLALPLGFTASLLSDPVVDDAVVDDVDGDIGVDACNSEALIARRGSVADTPALCGSALVRIHQWALRAVLHCVSRTTRSSSNDGVVSLSALRTSQLSRMRDNRAERANWMTICRQLTRRMLSIEARAWTLHYASVIACNDDVSRAAVAGSRRRARPHHFGSILDASDCHALSRLRIN
jgi:DNA polymerase III delta prime subunit